MKRSPSTEVDSMRCVACGFPMCDHQPLRYVLRAWVKHRVSLTAGFLLGRFLRDITANY